MRQTKKYKAAQDALHEIRSLAHLGLPNDETYEYLARQGMAWFPKQGIWKKTEIDPNSAFQSPQGDPSNVVKIRVMVHPGIAPRVLEAIQEGLKQANFTVDEVSNAYANRRGVGERYYIDTRFRGSGGDNL